MILHNSKIDKIQSRYRVEYENKAKAKELGIEYKDYLKQIKEEESKSVSVKHKPGKIKFGTNFEFEIKVKNEDGKIEQYDEK